MVKKEIMIIADYSQETPLSLEELCDICQVSTSMINDLVNYGVISPQGRDPNEWVFHLDQLIRLKRAMRLQRDLELNMAGIALVLELSEELERLRTRMRLLEKHFSRF